MPRALGRGVVELLRGARSRGERQEVGGQQTLHPRVDGRRARAERLRDEHARDVARWDEIRVSARADLGDASRRPSRRISRRLLIDGGDPFREGQMERRRRDLRGHPPLRAETRALVGHVVVPPLMQPRYRPVRHRRRRLPRRRRGVGHAPRRRLVARNDRDDRVAVAVLLRAALIDARVDQVDDHAVTQLAAAIDGQCRRPDVRDVGYRGLSMERRVFPTCDERVTDYSRPALVLAPSKSLLVSPVADDSIDVLAM